MRTFFAWASGAGAVLILALGLLAGDRYMAMKLSLPQWDGTRAVSGLTAPVTLTRDRYAIPHIAGRNEADVLFGLGVAHAQDRLWQMEMSRRLAQGRLAEYLGPSAVPIDRFFRTLNFSAHAAAALPKLSPRARRLLEAYARGVNATLGDPNFKLPPEYQLLLVRPEPWTPRDSLLVLKMISLGLSMNMWQEINRALLSQKLTTRQITEFLPPYPGDPPLDVPLFSRLYAPDVFARLSALRPLLPSLGASNNWVVDGRHTVSGKPLLANDPHLELTAPSIWYLAHLSLPSGNIIGSTLAGFPGIILGRNDHIAWGFTNTGADVQDLFIEKVNPGNPNEYLTPKGYVPFEVRTETIKVRFGRDVSITIRGTRHGPVLSDSLGQVEGIRPAGSVVALAWTALTDDDLTAEAALSILFARSWQETLAAVSHQAVPMQNIVYADIDGNIGFIAPARVPIRGPENDLYGLLPAPGWDARYDWQGFIPFEALPRRFNPPSGRIVTANHKIVADDYPYFITSQWQPGYRARRITELLRRVAHHDIASFKALQADDVSLLARDLLPLMRAASPTSEGGKWAWTELAGWNGKMTGEARAPLLFIAWYRELARAIYGDELGPLFPQFWSFRPVFMTEVLKGTDGRQRWCDNIETAPRETCRDVLGTALDRAVEALERRFGPDRSTWTWGRAHTAIHAHNPFGQMPFFNRLFNLVVPSSGGFYTINRGGHRFNSPDPYANIHGSGYRAIYDLSDLDRSVFLQATGQSGHVFSPYYRSFLERWADVDYVSMSTRPEDYEPAAIGRLVLQPLTSP